MEAGLVLRNFGNRACGLEGWVWDGDCARNRACGIRNLAEGWLERRDGKGAGPEPTKWEGRT